MDMGIIEIVSAIFLIVSCIFIIAIVFFQGGGKGGMSQSITGQSSDNYYQRNMGRSKEMKLKKMTVVAAVFFFTVAIGVNVIAVHFSGNNEAPVENPPDDEFDLNDLFGDDFDFDFGDEDSVDDVDNEIDDDNDDDNSDDDDEGGTDDETEQDELS